MFTELYAATYQRLGFPLTDRDGTPESEIRDAEQRVGLRIPPALRDYYLVAGRESHLNQAHNRLLPPSEWERHDHHLLFMEENQVVVVWSVDAGSAVADPPIFQGNGEPLDWYPENVNCATFLAVMLHWQAVNAETLGCGGFRTADESARRGLDAAWFCAGEANGLRAYTRDAVALCMLPWDNAYQLVVAGPNEASVVRALEAGGLQWDGFDQT